MHKPDYTYRERGTRTTFKFFLTHFNERGAVYRVVVRNNRVAVFEGERYSPSPIGRATPRDMANDIVSFATSYVERPEEFDRSPSDREQVCASWWRKHGDLLSMYTESRGERKERGC